MYKCNYLALFTFGIFSLVAQALADPAATTQETIVFVRHGEKPASGENGQLTCQGQNRALALPHVMLTTYGTPDYIFAVQPKLDQDDNGVDYYYLRALATIEPTAVAAGLTINLKYDKDDIDDLESELMKSQYATAVVFVAWEHNEMDQLVTNIVHDNGGNSSVVPSWPDDDYDSVFVVGIGRTGADTSVTFTHDYEGLNDRSVVCSTNSPAFFRPYPLPHSPNRP
jgi:hypothetical protein